MAFTGWAAILLLIKAFLGSPLQSGYLADADDYLRMSRIFDLLDGRHYPSWIQPRLGPGGSVENGWSRLIDGPLYLLMLFFQLFFTRQTAALWTATVFPAMALMALVFVSLWYVRSAAGEDKPTAIKTFFTLCVMPFLTVMLYQFCLGRVTHHDWQIVLTVASYACLARVSLRPTEARWPVLTGILFATGLGIGADIVPWFALGVLVIGIHFLIRGSDYELAALRLGLSVTLATAVWFIILVPPERFLVPQCDTISPTYLSFAAAVGAFWGGIYLMPPSWKSNIARRFAVAELLALGIFIIIYKLSPVCFHDIYDIHDPLVRMAWRNRVAEAQPIFAVTKADKGSELFMLLPVALALFGALLAIRIETARRLWWIGLVTVLACGGALAFWQFRTLGFTQALSVAPIVWLLNLIFRQLTALAARAWTGFRSLGRRQRLAIEISLFAFSSLFGVVTLTTSGGTNHPAPAMHVRRGLMQERCSVKDAASALNAIPAPKMIAAYVDEGSEIIYRTQHWALAGHYHRDEEGIGAAYRIFIAPDDNVAYKIVKKYDVGIVMVCPAQRIFWDSISPTHNYFAARILDGRVPAWLTRVPSAGAIQIYLVNKHPPA
ncbi:MAG TPA: hypothetical protein VL625_03895 [Patescibacteria group bacterium]|nr:hypothetical protein [Patescibacteria group bacterium]